MVDTTLKSLCSLIEITLWTDTVTGLAYVREVTKEVVTLTQVKDDDSYNFVIIPSK